MKSSQEMEDIGNAAIDTKKAVSSGPAEGLPRILSGRNEIFIYMYDCRKIHSESRTLRSLKWQE